MSTIANELLTLNSTKLAIKEAIINKGVEVGEEDTFASYADKIEEIEGGGGGGTEIDTSKVDYQIGNGNIGLYEGRCMRGFSSMNSRCAFVVNGLNNSDIGVPWSDSFEIGARFKLTAYPSSSAFQFIFGNGANGTSYRFYCPSLFISGSKLALQVGASSNSWLITEDIDYTIELDTWYFVKLKFVKSTLKLTLDISTDMSTYTNLYDNTLTQTPFYNSSNSYLAIGGDCRQADRTTDSFYVDTFNTYIKNYTGSIVWGCFEGSVGSEYELYDYIQSDGTQCIDTRHQLTSGDTVGITFMNLGSGQYSWPFGAIETSRYFGMQMPPNDQLAFFNGSSTSPFYYDRISQNQIYFRDCPATATLNANIGVFGYASEDGTYGTNVSIRLYNFNINGNYFLPAKRKLDGVFGLYDVTNKAFLTDSAGGNAFVGGNPTGVEV